MGNRGLYRPQRRIACLAGGCRIGGKGCMLFSEKLNLLLQELNIPHTVLSRSSGLDASLISRFRSGERVPSRFSAQLDKLAIGAAVQGAQLGRSAALCALCGVPVCEDIRSLTDAISAWLNAEESGLRSQRARNVREKARRAIPLRTAAPPHAFAEKLDALMRAMDVSNVRLARYLNVDASLISRFRSGVRRPDAEGRIISNICTYFSTIRSTAPQRTTLCALLGIPLTDDPEALHAALCTMLRQPRGQDERVFLDNFLDKLDVFSAPGLTISGKLPPYIEGIVPQAVVYYAGVDGFRKAVLHFLRTALSSGSVRELLLYSDQNMDWLTQDEEFARTCASLMMQVLAKKIRVRIIHNVDRDLPEMLQGIEKWLPLYMTGLIDPYFCRRVRNSRFSFTVFIADKAAAVSSACVASAASIAQYAFTTDPLLIGNMRAQFASLLRSCGPLMQIFTPDSAQSYLQRLAQFERAEGDTDALLCSLSSYTMPHALLKSILARAGVDAALSRPVLEFHALSIKRAQKNLALFQVSDYIALPTDAQLFDGQVPVALPGLGIDQPVYYTPEEYAAHIAAMLRLLRENPRYSIHLLPESPFANVTVVVRQGVGTLFRKSAKPMAAFLCDHPMLYDAYSSYMDTLKMRSQRVYPESGQAFAAMSRFLK